METVQKPARAHQGKRRAAPRDPAWNGVRMRTLAAGADPDAPLRQVSLPVDWDDQAAAALAELAPGQGAVALAAAASAWTGRLSRDCRASPGLGDRLSRLLLERAAAPGRGLWHIADQAASQQEPVFGLNLAAFARAGLWFDLDGFIAAIDTVAEACRLAAAAGRSGRLLLANLDGCLATLGLDYDSAAARDAAACLTALATASAHPDTIAGRAAFSALPAHSVIPMLAQTARSAWQQAAARASGQTESGQTGSGQTESGQTPQLFAPGGQLETGFSSPGAVDALLGVEACGMAPIFSPLRADGRLSASTLARLAARSLSPEAALAASLSGQQVLRPAGLDAMQAMHRAVAPFVDRAPLPIARQPDPVAAPSSREPGSLRNHVGRSGPGWRELPARHGGFTQKAAVGGHRLYLRTGEYADGSLGEIAINAVRDGPPQRGLMDAFSQSVSLGLQHGVPLEAYVEAFAYTRFGPQGAVEGDEAVGHATSLLDYTFRTLARTYLGRTVPDAPELADPQAPGRGDVQHALLPLDLPQSGQGSASAGAKAATRQKPGVRQRHGLKLVG